MDDSSKNNHLVTESRAYSSDDVFELPGKPLGFKGLL